MRVVCAQWATTSIFDDVDVYLPVEHDVAGQKHIMPSIIRAANRKTVREIHREIRAAQMQDVTKDVMRFQSLLYQIPQLVRQVIWEMRQHMPENGRISRSS